MLQEAVPKETMDFFPHDLNVTALLEGSPDFLDYANFSSMYPLQGNDIHVFASVIRWMDYVLTPLIIAIGLIGNTLSVAVFIGSHLRRLSSSIYLAALAISDTGFLLCVFIKWIQSPMGVNFYHTSGGCQSISYLTYVLSFLSVWYVLGFTAERYIAVCLPFHRQRWCTTKRAKFVVISLAIFALLAYSFALWTTGIDAVLDNRFCVSKEKYYFLVTCFDNADTVLTLVIPSITILVMNIRIIHCVMHIYKIKNPRLNANNIEYYHQGSNEEKNSKTNRCLLRPDHKYLPKAPSRSQVRVTKLLVLVSTIFLVLNLPSHAIRVHISIASSVQENYTPGMTLLFTQRIFQYLYYVNFSINFFLYNGHGRNFRRALEHMYSKFRYSVSKRLRRRNSQGALTRTTAHLVIERHTSLHSHDVSVSVHMDKQSL